MFVRKKNVNKYVYLDNKERRKKWFKTAKPKFESRGTALDRKIKYVIVLRGCV